MSERRQRDEITLQIIREVNQEILREWQENPVEVLRKESQKEFEYCIQVLKDGGLDIGLKSFLDKYGNKPIQLLRKFIEDSVRENKEAEINKIIAKPNKQPERGADGSLYEGLARLFNYYGLNFVDYLLPSGDFEKPDSMRMFDFWSQRLTLKVCKKMCDDLEEAIREKRFKEQSA